MPQFDILLYFPMFITFIIYMFLLYTILSLYIIPFFWNIYYFRYLKKETNYYYKLLNKIFLNLKKKNFFFFNLNIYFYYFIILNYKLNIINKYLNNLKYFLLKIN
jgi:hypothetical protein